MFTSDRMYELTPPGVTMGLAWTASGRFQSILSIVRRGFSLGGSVLFIESRFINPVEALDSSSATTKDEKNNALAGSLTLTGKLGDVMKESCKIALTYAKSFLQQIDPNNRSLRVGHIHVHVPEVRVQANRISSLPKIFVCLGSNTKRWSICWLYHCYCSPFTWFE